MREPGLEILSKTLRVCLQITFVAGLAVTAFLWLIMREWFYWYFWNDERYYRACVLLITPCGISSLYILWQLIRLLKSISHRNPFVQANVNGLKRIAISSFIISALFALLLYFRATVLTFGIAYIFLIAGFCFIVLAGLFQRAVAYKDENDLTI